MASFLERISATSNAKGAGSTYMPLAEPTNRSSGRAENVGSKQEQEAQKTSKWQQTMDVIDDILGIKKPSVQPETMANAPSSVSTGFTTNVSTGEKFRQPATELMPKTEDELRSELAELQSQIDREIALSGLATSAEQGAEQGQKIQSLREREIQLKSQLGEPTARDRVSNFLSGLLKSNAAAATGGQRLLYEAGQGARSAMNEDLYNTAQYEYDRALQAYNETVAEFGEENAWVEKNVLDAAKTKLDAFGAADEAQKGAAEEAADFANALQYGSQKDYEATKEGLGTAGRLAVDAAAGAGDILVDIATGVPTLSMAARAFGNAANEADSNGATVDKQLDYALAQAGKSYMLKKLLGGVGKVYGKSKLASVTDKVWNKVSKNPATAKALKVVMNSEGVEEVVEAAIDPATRTIYSDKSLAEEYSEEELADWLYSGLVGQILGAGFTGLEVATEGRNAAPQPQPQPQSEAAPEGNIPATPTAPNASTSTPDVLNSNIQPQSAADIVVEAAMGQQTAPTQQNNAPAGANGGQGQGPLRTRGYETNVASSKVTDPALAARVEQDIRTYRQLGNNDTLKKAQDIMLQGLPAAQAQLQEAIGAAKNGAKLSPEMVPLSRLVANELTRSGDVETARQIIADVAVELTAAGQLGQAGRIMRTADPATALDSIRKALDKINDEFSKKMPNSQWEADLTAEEEQLIANTDFTQDGAFEQVYEQIAKRLGAEMPATLSEKYRELSRVSMLLNPKTQVKNVLGNVPLAIERKGADALSAALQNLAVKAGVINEADRTRAIASKGSRDLAEQYYTANRAEIEGSGNKTDLRGQIREYRQYFGGGVLDKARNLTYKALQKGDAPFVKSAFVDSLSQYLEAQGITDIDSIPKEAIDKAITDANRATFKNENAIASLINAIKNKGGIVGEAVDILFPFTTTPLNIASEFASYSPAGVVTATGKAISAKRSGDSAKMVEAIDSLAKGLTGSAVIGLGLLLKNAGLITGSEDEDKDKAALDRATGRQAYSIGGKWSYEWAQPVGSQLAMGAEIADALANGNGNLLDAILDGVIAGGDAYFEQTFFGDIIDIFSSDESFTTALMENISESGTGRMFPSVVGAAARTIDPVVRSTYSGESGAFSGVDEQIIAKTPGLSTKLPASINVKGEEQSRGDFLTAAADNFLKPWNTNRNQRNAVDDEVYRILEETGSKTHFPSVSPYSVEFDGESFKMTGEERAQFQTTQGQTYQDVVGELINNAVYKAAPVEQQREMLEDVRDYALAAAKSEFLSEKGKEYEWPSKVAETMSLLDDPATYIAIMTMGKETAASTGKSFDANSTEAFKLYNAADMNTADLMRISQNLGETQQEIYSALNENLNPEKAKDIYPYVTTGSDAQTAVQIGQIPGLSLEDKMNALMSYLPADDKDGSIPTELLRYRYAAEKGYDYDTWSAFMEQVIADEAKYGDGDGRLEKAEIYNTAARMGYPAYTMYSIYSKASKNIDKIDEDAIKPQTPKVSQSYKFSPNDLFSILGLNG